MSRNHTDNPILDCNQCGKSYARPGSLELHKRTCVGGRESVVAPAAKRRRTGDVAQEFEVRRTRKSLGGVVEQFTIDTKEAKHLSALKKAVVVFKPVMAKFHPDHQAYKFQVTVDVVFHKAVDPAIITQPPVTLTSEMVAVYSDGVPPLEDVNHQLVNFIEVYKLNGSGWVLSHFAALKLTLWHLDPLRASAFVILPHWIRDKKAVVNVTGTGNDALGFFKDELNSIPMEEFVGLRRKCYAFHCTGEVKKNN